MNPIYTTHVISVQKLSTISEFECLFLREVVLAMIHGEVQEGIDPKDEYMVIEPGNVLKV